jgi:predicted transposase YbfD/YdcC
VNFKVPFGLDLCFKLGMPNTRPKLSLIAPFKTLPEPRVKWTKDHELLDVLTIGVCTLLCVLALKGNHEVVHEEVKSFLDATVTEHTAQPVRPSRAAATLAKLATVKKDHGRTEPRRCYLSSLPVGVETFAKVVRGHWSVENSLHWVLNMQMCEDDSRARTGYAAENLATRRRPALNLSKQEKTKKRGLRGKQLNASWNHAYLLRLLGVPI